jgi:hypothetical protein
VAGAPLRVNSLSGRTSSSVDSQPAYVVISSIPCPTTVRWSLAIFVSTLPFEHLGWAFMDGSVSIAKLAGFLFFGFYFLHHVSPFGKRSLPRIPTAMWWFLVFLAIYTVNGGLLGSAEYRGDFVSSLFQLVQLIVMLWLCSDLLKDERTARGVLLAYTIAAAVLGSYFKFQDFMSRALKEGPQLWGKTLTRSPGIRRMLSLSFWACFFIRLTDIRSTGSYF